MGTARYKYLCKSKNSDTLPETSKSRTDKLLPYTKFRPQFLSQTVSSTQKNLFRHQAVAPRYQEVEPMTQIAPLIASEARIAVDALLTTLPLQSVRHTAPRTDNPQER